jgi:AcrR family transcriptional regulator
MITTNEQKNEATYRLRKTLAVEGFGVAPAHPWLWEVDRWRELVFALLTRVADNPEEDLRELTKQMADLDLLDVGELAKLHEDRDAPLAQRITELMTEMGIAEDQAGAALTTVIEAAWGLDQHYGGEIQRYLRRYGEQMLREIDESFHFTEMKPDAVAEAFTYWLQNVLSMPLSLTDESEQAFCERYGFTPLELREAADRLGLNLSVVDDLVQLHMAHERPVGRR